MSSPTSPDDEPIRARPRLTRRHLVMGLVLCVVAICALALISEGFTAFIKFLLMLFIRMCVRMIRLVFRF